MAKDISVNTCGQVPIKPTNGQAALARRLIDNSEGELGEAIGQIAASAYTDPAIFAREQSALFGAQPQVLAPSALLPNPGEAIAHDLSGRPLLLTRDENGAAHIFANVCKHRGTRLVAGSERQCKGRLTCPYHAWTYRLDGSLLALPRPDTFPGIDKGDFNLTELPSYEAGGLIWYCPELPEPKDADAKDKERSAARFADAALLTEDFEALALSGSHLFSRKTHKVRANWKLIMDAFLESYHVARLHSGTIAPFFQDGVTAFDHIGIHHRSVVARVDALTDADFSDMNTLRAHATFAYQLVPATLLIFSPDYVNVMCLWPSAYNETMVEDFMLTHRAPQSAEEEEHWNKSWALLDDGVFASEDFRAAEMGQEGLESGALDQLTIGTLENGITEFHAALHKLIAAGR